MGKRHENRGVSQDTPLTFCGSKSNIGVKVKKERLKVKYWGEGKERKKWLKVKYWGEGKERKKSVIK